LGFESAPWCCGRMTKEESSFFEKKEAKKLLVSGAALRCEIRLLQQKKVKVFLLLFLQKKKNLPKSAGAPPLAMMRTTFSL
jgi:hypothetical protein